MSLRKGLRYSATHVGMTPLIVLVAAWAAAPPAAQGSAAITSVAGGGPHDVAALSVAIYPEDLVVDAAGNVYFPSRFAHRIYKVDTGGILRLVAGTGIEHALGDGGPIDRASFLLPDEIALTPSGDLLVYGGGEAYGCCNPDFDEWNRLDLLLRRLNFASGAAELVTDSFYSAPAFYLWPDDLAVSPSGTIFAAAHGLFTEEDPASIGQIHAVDPTTGAVVRVAGNYDLGGPLNDGMPATDVALARVDSVALASLDELLLSDREHGRIRTVDLTTGIINSHPPAAGLYGSMTLDPAGNLHVTETSVVWRIDRVTGAVSAVAGRGIAGFDGDGGLATNAQIRATWIAFDGGGNLYLAGDGRIRRVDQATHIIQTVAGDPSVSPYGDGGLATQALVRHPVDVATAPSGDLYIAEAGWTALRKVDGTTGEITALLRGAYGDTGASNLHPPTLSAIAYHQGTLYYAKKSTITDIGPVTEDAVYRFNFTTGESHRIAGEFGPSCTGEGGLAVFARLNHPRDISFYAGGNLFIADAQNHQVRRVDGATGIITRVVGMTGTTWCATNEGFNGDGLHALQTQLNYPSGIALDAAGNLFIADTRNHRIRRVDAATGIVETVAGTGVAGFSGDGGHAVMAGIRLPERIEIGAGGRLYIAADERIRVVDPHTGIISTLAGDGILGFHGDGGPAASAGLGGPRGMAFDASGDLLVASYEAGRVRKVDLPVDSTLTLVKTVINDDGGTLQVADFPLFINGQPATSGVPVSLLADATYTVTESTRPGYAPSAWGGDCSPDGTITLLPGDDRACTITNDDVALTATASATPTVLWPPNHQLIAVHVDLETGATPGGVTIELLSITSSEPDDAPGGGDGATEDDVQLADIGTADFDFLLRAERSGGGAGRIYTIVYLVSLGAGQSTTATAFVTVPHDMGGVVDPMALGIQETASGTVLTWEEIPGANSYSILRGTIGALTELPDIIDMGSVVCVESRSKDLTTVGEEDVEIPGPGEGFFYVGEYRDPHPSTYGSPDAPKPRAQGPGACN